LIMRGFPRTMCLKNKKNGTLPMTCLDSALCWNCKAAKETIPY